MASNPNLNKSAVDSPQVLKYIYDADHEAIRILMACDHETEISVSHEDGDSVRSVAHSALITEQDGVVDCSIFRRIYIYGQGTAEVSPDGELWVEVTSGPVCAMKLRVTGCKVVGQS